MGQALYRKYRSKSLSELVGQEHVTTTLARALKNDKISHAYLFTGPRGVGKTSVARILAHEVNHLQYDDKTHLDIIEIDAASNRRIDEIRDLRDKVFSAPTEAKFKVYIIDEVHMLTKEAFNALLKTLEEPPAHVIFILATTEAHKLPDTIISRTQRFSFRPVPDDLVVSHLRDIAKKEKISIDDEALRLIARHGEGSLRDSLSLLDQASNAENKITLSTIQAMLGLASSELIDQILEAIKRQDATDLVKTVNATLIAGNEPAMVAAQLSEVMRLRLLEASPSTDQSTTFWLLKELLNISAARDPKRLLELTLLEAIFKGKPESVKPENPPPATEQSTTLGKKPVTTTPKSANTDSKVSTKISAIKPEVPKITSKQNAPVAEDNLWPEVLKLIKTQHNTLYGIARMAKTTFEADELTLSFNFAFHQKRCNEAKNRLILVSALKELSGRAYKIHCLVETEQNVEPPVSPVSDMPTQPDQEEPLEADNVTSISNIFGGAELLES